MKTTTITQLDRQISQKSRQIKALARRKKLMETLLAKRERIEKQLSAISTNGDLQPKQREFPRGVLTMALAEALKTAKKGLTVNEIIEKAKEIDMVPADKLSPARVQNLLNSSPRFKRLERGVYKVSGELDGALFDRIRSEELATA